MGYSLSQGERRPAVMPAVRSLCQRHAAKPLEARAAAFRAAHLDAASVAPTGGANRAARADALLAVDAALNDPGPAIGPDADPEFLGH